ncbi:cell division protein ZapE [Consotaella salsifontis]|uniref:Cell division protein ZapE n=1 Tax=Consotaella salsifontis TaxID=1365950 RepID=A0A1T4T547_9HYPH|nr:cell division protein ZapE [Consotaella salsifontis]
MARLVALGEIEADPAQRALAQRLDQLDAKLSAAMLSSKTSALGWLFGRRTSREPVKGVYIHGAVGRGKTMLMDMFFRGSSVARKRRVHFHAFMAEVHERIRAQRAAIKEGRGKSDDPIPPVAAAIAEEARLLCFDEFAVNDIADAMILSRLFTALFAEGVVLVATSNVAPDDLYHQGLNRPLFLPFVDILKANTDIFRLDAATDYRLMGLARADLYVTPLGPQTKAHMDATWEKLLCGERESRVTLSVKGHALHVPRAGNGAARFDFDSLLRKPVGAQDFLALSARFHTVMLEGVPALTQAERNEARRFIILVDTLYDAHRRIVISAEVEADRLYSGRNGAEVFEFERTVSRLIEMRSEEYLAGLGETC